MKPPHTLSAPPNSSDGIAPVESVGGVERTADGSIVLLNPSEPSNAACSESGRQSLPVKDSELDFGQRDIDESGAYRVLASHLFSPSIPADLQRQLRAQAGEEARRSRGELASGLGAQVADGGEIDPMVVWHQNELAWQTRAERRAGRLRMARHLAVAFAGCSALLAFVALDLPPQARQVAGLGEVQQALRTGAQGALALMAPGAGPWRGGSEPSVGDAAQPMIAMPASLPEGEVAEISWTWVDGAGSGAVAQGIEPGAAAGVLVAGPGLPRRLVTSARAARELHRSLESWTQLPNGDRGRAGGAAWRPQLVSGGSSASDASLDSSLGTERNYCAPADVAVRALQEALRADYPDSVPLEPMLPAQAGLVEVRVRRIAGADLPK